MIQRKAIGKLVSLLEDRGVLLYHACQVQDLKSYLELRGIPSRHLLARKRVTFTRFETDNNDRINRVWDKVFANLVDLGEWFAEGRAATPNAYGPVLLHISPRALLYTKSVAICLRSAGAAGFNRQRESLHGVDEVDRLFEFPADTEKPRSALLKDKTFIRRDFNNPTAELPEVSLSISDQRIPFRYVKSILVDPYSLKSKSLTYWVSSMVSNARLQTQITTRRSTRKALYQELGNFILSSGPGLARLFQANNISPQLKVWSGQILNNDLQWLYNRYSQYLYDGTLIPIANRQI